MRRYTALLVMVAAFAYFVTPAYASPSTPTAASVMSELTQAHTKADFERAKTDTQGLPRAQLSVLRTNLTAQMAKVQVAFKRTKNAPEDGFNPIGIWPTCGILTCTWYWQRWLVSMIAFFTYVLGPLVGGFIGWMACGGYPPCGIVVAVYLAWFLHIVGEASAQWECVGTRYMPFPVPAIIEIYGTRSYCQ